MSWYNQTASSPSPVKGVVLPKPEIHRQLARAAKMAYDEGLGADSSRGLDSFVGIPFYGDTTHSLSGVTPAVWACVQILTNSLSNLPMYVVEYSDSRRKVKKSVEGHPLDGVLRYPSQIMDRSQLWSWVAYRYITRGNAYLLIRRDGNGNPFDLHPVLVDDARWVVAKTDGRPTGMVRTCHYITDLGRGSFEANESDLLRFQMGTGFNGKDSPGPLTQIASQVVRLISEVRAHNEKSVKGTMPYSTLSYQTEVLANMTPDQMEELHSTALSLLKTSVQEASSTNILTLPPGTSLNRSPGLMDNASHMLELLKFSVVDVCRIFNVPLRYAMELSKGGDRGGSDVVDQAVDFERFSIRPHALRWESQLTYKCLSIEDRDKGLEVFVDSTKVAEGTLVDRWKRAGEAYADYGIASLDEAREEVELPPYTSSKGEGKKVMIPKGAPGKEKQL